MTRAAATAALVTAWLILVAAGLAAATFVLATITAFLGWLA